MRTSLKRSLRAARGAATVEFALVVPLLVVILLFSMYLTELVRAKIKVLEAARHAAWELTSFPLSDFATADHDKAWTEAHDKVHEDAMARFGDMDSVEPDLAPSFIADTSNLQVTIEKKDIPFFDVTLLTGTEGEGGNFATGIMNGINGGANAMLGLWGFNKQGMVTSRVSLDFNNRLLPRNYLNEGETGFFDTDFTGGRDLSTLTLSSHHALYADSWSMPDGQDAVVRERRAGAHRGGDLDKPHGIYQQVGRMTFLGLNSALDKVGIGQVLDFLGNVIPNPLGTFVVSHNYGPMRGDSDPNCEGIPSYPGYANSPANDARGGLNSFYRPDYKNLDGDDVFRPRCFDTAPFRDRTDYNKKDKDGRDLNGYIAIFKSRGEFFLGCKNAQAEDPSEKESKEATAADENTSVVNCE